MENCFPLLYSTNDECCGCSACAAVCRQNAIKLLTNEEGFFYPSVDSLKCVKCLMCEKVCAFKRDCKKTNVNRGNTLVYAVINKDMDTVLKSSSGGVFSALSDAYLKNGDAVASCVYAYESNSLVMTVYEDYNTRNQARGSKYIQGMMNTAYSQIIAWLDDNPGKKMLIIGTGCQISGINSVLTEKRMRDRVLLVDLICHGTSSPNLWKQYCNFLEKKYDGPISNLTFKDKKDGWEKPRAYVTINEVDVPIKSFADWFYMGLTLRESCYICPYTHIDRDSDITIGDFWGIKEQIPDFYCEQGVSLMLVHSSKGKECFAQISEFINYVETDTKTCLQPRLSSPQKKPELREKFWKDMSCEGIEFCEKKYKKQKESTLAKVSQWLKMKKNG